MVVSWGSGGNELLPPSAHFFVLADLASQGLTLPHIISSSGFYMATGLVVFQIGREILGNDLAAFAGSLLWLLHPLHVEAVAWIGSVPEMGCGFFYLLAFRLFLRAEKAGSWRVARHTLAVLAYLPALFFKEAAFSFPLLLIAYWFFFSDAVETWRRRAACWAMYAGAAVIYSAARVAALGHFSGARHLWKIRPKVIAAALGLLGQHARLFFWPVHLNVFHTFDPGPTLRSPWSWLTLLILVAAGALRKRRTVLGFLIVWWLVTFLPCLDVRHLSFPLLAERFSHLPSVGICLGLPVSGPAAAATATRLAGSGRAAPPRPRDVLLVFSGYAGGSELAQQRKPIRLFPHCRSGRWFGSSTPRTRFAIPRARPGGSKERV
jgi:hypothetical protein